MRDDIDAAGVARDVKNALSYFLGELLDRRSTRWIAKIVNSISAPSCLTSHRP